MSASYDTAEFTKVSCGERFKAFFTIVKAFTLAILVSIPIFFKWLIIPQRPKGVTGQLALITGGSAGIGRAIALSLAHEGCNVAIVNRNREMGERVAAEIREKFKVKAAAFEADVANRHDVARLKTEVEASLGEVDILVNNAGVLSLEHSLLEGEDEEYQRVVDINLTSYFWTTRAFLPGMMERRCGHIVSVSSLSVRVPIFGLLAYTTTKYGNVGFMDALHEDLHFQGFGDCIKTTTALPAVVATQKKAVSISESLTHMPVNNVHAIGRDIVAGMLRNRRKVIVPWYGAFVAWISWFPDQAAQIGKMAFIRKDNLEEYKKIRRELK